MSHALIGTFLGSRHRWVAAENVGDILSTAVLLSGRQGTVRGMHESDLRTARTAYDAIAAMYADQFKDTLEDRPIERGLLAAFAELVLSGPGGSVADLGCGPGHIAAYLHGLGLSVLGVDQSAEMLEIGRARYPEVRFVLSSMPRLGLADASCCAVLSRSSIIHLPPALLPAALTEFARSTSFRSCVRQASPRRRG